MLPADEEPRQDINLRKALLKFEAFAQCYYEITTVTVVVGWINKTFWKLFQNEWFLK